jgi:hypothetical protein
MTLWLLFTYQVPNEPSAPRVYVWRKLKALGAILIHDSIWVLPDVPPLREKLQWLVTEVRDMKGGEASLWESRPIFTGQDDNLIQQFTEQVDSNYRAILAELEAPDADLEALAKRYQQTTRQDYFQSSLGEQVRTTLIERRGTTDR